MLKGTHILISLESRHAEGILDSIKRVELRRRPMLIPIGTTVWFYVKVPVGKVIGCAQVQSKHALAPRTLWERFGANCGLSRSEFFDYFCGVAKGFALALERPHRLDRGIALDELRSMVDGFQPPQFFQHLAYEGPLVKAFLRQAARTAALSRISGQGSIGEVPNA
jgi:predicted transcriptional regulator